MKKFGHNLFEGIREAATKAYQFGQKAYPYIKTAVDVASTAAKLAPLIGLGDDDMSGEGVLIGDQEMYRNYGGSSVGGNIVGGRMMDRSRLRERLRRL